MRFRDQIALTLPALLLRLTLCLIFTWAGLGKILGETTVTGDSAARLARMGVAMTPVNPPASTPSPARTLPDTTPTTPATPPTELIIPDSALPAGQPAAKPAAQPAGQPTTDKPVAPPTTPPTNPANPPANPTTDATMPPMPLEPTAMLEAPRWLPVQNTRPNPTAADFPGAYRVQRLYAIALVLSRAGDPGLSPESKPIPRTMPAWVGADTWPRILAWAAAVTELLAAFMLFFGVLTRFGALMVIGIMLQAMWLTQIGPAVVGRVDAYIGFIPASADPWDPLSYQALFLQVACLVMAGAVFLLGAGPISFDRALFRPAERLERSEPAPKNRTTFDRQPTDTP